MRERPGTRGWHQLFRQREDRSVEDLEAELELAKAEIARLRTERQHVVDGDRATRRVEELLEVLRTMNDDGDGVWELHAETLRLRTTLLELCGQVEQAMQAVRHELRDPTPLVEIDRRRAPVEPTLRSVAAGNGHQPRPSGNGEQVLAATSTDGRLRTGRVDGRDATGAG